jgi:hypothetical protein
VASATTIAYGRASCPYRLTSGRTAKTRPEASPARGEISRLPSAATAAAAPAIATADGSLVTSSPVPPRRTMTQMIR